MASLLSLVFKLYSLERISIFIKKKKLTLIHILKIELQFSRTIFEKTQAK